MIKLNGVIVQPTIFPDKTSQVWQLPDKCFAPKECLIVWEFESEAELIHLAQLKDLLDSYDKISYLKMPYLPYARQDKFFSNQTSFALRTFIKLLNKMAFDKVTCTDPHNLTVVMGIKNIRVKYPITEIWNAFHASASTLLCYPDEGALGRYQPILATKPYIHAKKTRDQKTGEITEYALCGDPRGETVLIVDDICDGGATFKQLSTMLYEKGALAVHLYVSHGLFSKGVETLRDSKIKQIFTKDGEIK